MAANMASSTATATAFANDKQQPRQSHRNILTHTIPTTNNDIGTIDLHVFEPPSTSSSPSSPSIVDIPNDTNETDNGSLTGTIITVHPWSFLGGGEHNTIGLAKHLLHCQNRQSSIRRLIPRGRVAKWRVVTFALRSTPVFWKGGAVGGILGRHRCEVRQIVDVVDWVVNKYYDCNDWVSSDGWNEGEEAPRRSGLPIVLLGSSAGAPMAGSAMDLILRRQRDEERRRRRNRQRRQEVEEHAEELPENQKETFRDETTTNDDDCNKMYFHRGNLVSAYIAIGYTFGKFASLGFGRHFSSLFGPSANSSSTSWCFAKTAVSPNSDDNADDDDDIHNGQPHKLFIMGENDEFTSPSQLEHWAHKIRLSNNPQSSADTKKENRGERKNKNTEDHHHVRPLVVDGDRRRSNRRECRVDTKIIPHVGHFELESPGYNGLVANLIMEWLNDVLSV